MYPNIYKLFQEYRNCATPDTKNHLKKDPLDVAKKYVETYSSSNAAARNPEERAFYI